MKYFTSFGCVLLGVFGLSSAPRSVHAQDPAAPAPAPAPRTAPAPAPAEPVQAPAPGALPPTEPAGTAPGDPASAAEPIPAAPPGAAPTEPASPGADAAQSADKGQVAAEGAKPASREPRTWQIPAVGPETAEDDPAPGVFSGQLGSHQDHWIAWLGVRNDYVRDANFDLFAGNDALTVFSVGGGRTVWTSGNLSLAALGLWEIGSKGEDIRGNETSLRVQRLQVAPEVRYHLHYRVHGFGRLGLGAEHLHATIEDELSGGELVSNSWAFVGDLAAGAAVQFVGSPSGERRQPRGWILAEGGYALATSSSLSFEPSSDDASVPERAEAEDLGELNLSAPFFRLALRGTY